MFKNLRRSTRENDYLPITVSAKSVSTGTVLTDPFPCHIINISTPGVCLFMTRVMEGSFHIFHSIRENKDTLLQLHLLLPPDNKQLVLTALPVWLDLFQENQHRGFKMGVEFTPAVTVAQMKEIRRSLKTQREERCKRFHL